MFVFQLKASLQHIIIYLKKQNKYFNDTDLQIKLLNYSNLHRR